MMSNQTINNSVFLKDLIDFNNAKEENDIKYKKRCKFNK